MDGEYWRDIPLECFTCNELFHPSVGDEARTHCYDCLPAHFTVLRTRDGRRDVPALPQNN